MLPVAGFSVRLRACRRYQQRYRQKRKEGAGTYASRTADAIERGRQEEKFCPEELAGPELAHAPVLGNDLY
jgi:hypothetical protein